MGYRSIRMVQDHLRQLGVRFFNSDEGDSIVVNYRYQNALLHCLLRSVPDNDWFGIEIPVGIFVPEHRREQVALWAARVNNNIWCGRFDVDMDRGDVTFCHGLHLGNTLVDPSSIMRMIEASCGDVDRYLPSLMQVVFGETDAATAARNATEPLAEIEEEDFVDLMHRLMETSDDDAGGSER